MNTSHLGNAATSPVKISQWLEKYQFSEHHETEIAWEVDRVFEAIENVDIFHMTPSRLAIMLKV